MVMSDVRQRVIWMNDSMASTRAQSVKMSSRRVTRDWSAGQRVSGSAGKLVSGWDSEGGVWRMKG